MIYGLQPDSQACLLPDASAVRTVEPADWRANGRLRSGALT